MKTKHGFTLIGVLAVLLPCVLFGQEKEAREAYSKNSVYAEFGGNGLLYSVNYDHRFAEHVSGRIGFTAASVPTFFGPSVNIIGFPAMIGYLAGSDGNYFEMGAGVILANVSVTGREIFFGSEVNESATRALGTATIGYRHQPSTGGFLFRIGVTPFTTFSKSLISGGLSAGVAF